MNKKMNAFTIIKRTSPQFFKVTPILFLIQIIMDILSGVSYGIVTVMQQKFFDEAAALYSGEATIKTVIFSLLLLTIISVGGQALNGMENYTPNVIITKINGCLSKEIHSKIGKMPSVVFEETDKLDFINKAEIGKNSALWFTFNLISIFTFYVPYFLFMAWYLFKLKPILSVSIICVFMPVMLTQLVRAKIFSRTEDASAPVRREYEYYEDCMVSREYFKETRLLGAFTYFKKLYLNALDDLQKLRYKATFKTGLMDLGTSLLTVAGYSSILYMLFSALMKKEISVGSFAAVFASISTLYMLMQQVFFGYIAGMAKDYGTIQNYLNFLDLPAEEGEDIELPDNHDIKLESVTFAYPNAEKKAVENVNLTIKNGETLAIVGENGSGKSTLVRLIMGLYTPTKGTVRYADYDTKKLSFKSLFRNTSAVFQNYQRYQMILADNIGISQVEIPTKNSILNNICKISGVENNDIEFFPHGYETMLSREFGGVDLSGGQWQRVAIARGFYRKHKLIILDEPTASIDPYEETRIYNQFAEISKDKTAIIVTHRLGSVKLADRVIVMKEGKIVQMGTHNTLIEEDGEYARLYKAQEQWYKEEIV